jgi:hypothetical protein
MILATRDRNTPNRLVWQGDQDRWGLRFRYSKYVRPGPTVSIESDVCPIPPVSDHIRRGELGEEDAKPETLAVLYVSIKCKKIQIRQHLEEQQ